jgi:hypothetical protein
LLRYGGLIAGHQLCSDLAVLAAATGVAPPAVAAVIAAWRQRRDAAAGAAGLFSGFVDGLSSDSTLWDVSLPKAPSAWRRDKGARHPPPVTSLKELAALRNLAICALRLFGRADVTEATRWAGRSMDRPFTILGLTS